MCEFLLVLIVLGIQKYFLDTFHILDAFVSIGALSELVIQLISISSSGGGSHNKSKNGMQWHLCIIFCVNKTRLYTDLYLN